MPAVETAAVIGAAAVGAAGTFGAAAIGGGATLGAAAIGAGTTLATTAASIAIQEIGRRKEESAALVARMADDAARANEGAGEFAKEFLTGIQQQGEVAAQQNAAFMQAMGYMISSPPATAGEDPSAPS